MQRQRYTFGRFAFDPRPRILTAEDQRVSIPPKTADILLALLERSGDLVSKDELMKVVWPETFVEESNIGKHIFLLRRTLGENEHGVPYIETIPRRGYRFVGNVGGPADSGNLPLEYEEQAHERIVIEERGKWPGAGIGSVLAVATLSVLTVAFFWKERTQAAGQWRSVLVVPFTTSGDTDSKLAYAFAQEVAVRLRTIRSLRVVSPLSTIDLTDAGNRFSVETVLSGNLDVGAGRLHAGAQLRSARDGAVLWAEDISGLEAGDFRAAVIQIAAAITARLSGRLLPGERASLERRGSSNAQAYQAYLRGRAEALSKSVDMGPLRARPSAHFETAVRLDPGFADAWAALALSQHLEWATASADRALLRTALDNARRALAIDPLNVAARHALIRIYHGNGDNESMLREAKSLLEIDQHDPEAQTGAAYAYRFAGMLDRAIRLYEQYVTAYPDDEDAWYQLVQACAFAGDYHRGMRHAQSRVRVQRLLFPAFLLYAYSGDVSAAAALARQSIAVGQGGAAAKYFAPLILDSAGFHAEAQSGWEQAAETLEFRLRTVDDEHTRRFLAMVYARLGRHDTARQHIERAWTSHPDPRIGFFASETYAIMKDRDAALGALRRAVAGGFLGIQYLDMFQRAPNGWHTYRNDPEFRQMYDGLARTVADLRTRY